MVTRTPKNHLDAVACEDTSRYPKTSCGLVGFAPSMSTLKLLHHCSFTEGGLARYAAEQRKALAKTKECLCLPFTPTLEQQKRILPGKLGRALSFIQNILTEQGHIAGEVLRQKPDWLLLSSWSEYLAPFWSYRFHKVRRNGTRIAALVHDPVRDYVRGPNWFHQASIRAAYSFVDLIFVHDASAITWGGLKQRPKVVEIPHGPYPAVEGSQSPTSLRDDFGLPQEAFVLLSFGHIRDGKNLDTILQALVHTPQAHLIIAGKEQSGGQKKVADYQVLARKIGVADRCHWYNNYIPDEEIWKYFRVANAVLLLYSKDFRSASGVLNVNAQFEKPVLASGGEGPLKKAVQPYHLGTWIETLSADEVARAVQGMAHTEEPANWARYRQDHSWERNAEIVMDALAEFSPGHPNRETMQSALDEHKLP